MNISPFDSFVFRRFASGQEIVSIIHTHPFALIERAIPWVFFVLFLPLFFYHFNSFSLRDILGASGINGILFMGYGVLFYQIACWYLRVWIVTPHQVIDLSYTGISFDERYIAQDGIVSVSSSSNAFYDPLIARGDIRIHTSDANLDPIFVASYMPDSGAESLRKLLLPHVSHEPRIHTLGSHSSSEPHPMSDQEAFALLLRTLTDVVKERTFPSPPSSEYRVGDDKPRHKHFVETAHLRDDTIDLRSSPSDEIHDGAHHGGSPPHGEKSHHS